MKTKFLLLKIVRLGNAIGINNDALAGVQFSLTNLELSRRQYSQRKSTRGKLLDHAVRPADERRIMSGVDISERRGGRVKLGDEKSDEAIRGGVIGKISIDG